jgi:hypothetical protein
MHFTEALGHSAFAILQGIPDGCPEGPFAFLLGRAHDQELEQCDLRWRLALSALGQRIFEFFRYSQSNGRKEAIDNDPALHSGPLGSWFARKSSARGHKPNRSPGDQKRNFHAIREFLKMRPGGEAKLFRPRGKVPGLDWAVKQARMRL